MSYEWITPKTDWTTTTRFEYTDYNRIRNNLLYINDMLNELYPDKAQPLDLGDAKTGYANEYAVSEFNAFEDALESFTRVGQDVNVGDRNYYHGNDSFIWADALNRIEQCCLRWYDLDPIVESAVISPSSYELELNKSKQLALTVVPSDVEYTVEWSSSNGSITVSNNGLITRVDNSNAETIITANVIQRGIVRVSATCQVTQLIPITKIEWDYGTGEVGRGADGVVTYSDVIITPSNATHKDDWYIDQKTEANTIISKQNGRIKIEFKRETEVEPTYHNDRAEMNIGDFYKIVKFVICANENERVISSRQYNAMVYRNGTYWEGDHGNEKPEILSFRLLKINSTNVHLISRVPYWLTGAFDNLDDRIASYRETNSWSIGNQIKNNFSYEMKNALKNFTKVVPTGETTTGNFSAKFHLPALNEIMNPPTAYDGTYQSLGSDTYPFAINGYALKWDARSYIMRSRFFDNDGTVHMVDNHATEDDKLPSGTSLLYYCAMLTNIASTTRLNFIKEVSSVKYYSIDWTGQSTLKISDVPLGSIIVDLDGSRKDLY